MQLTDTHREYWAQNLRLTLTLLAVWFLVTFGTVWFARDLAALSFAGWPLSFYMAAQGSLIVYVLLIWYYAKRMEVMDQEFGVDEDA
jgi:putative solute:sodium symporter small subunit